MPKGISQSIVLSQITGIGEPYAVSCLAEERFPEQLNADLVITFRMLEGKHCMQSRLQGVLCAIDQTGAVLRTDHALHALDNICLDACGDLFAKVIRRTDDGWLLRFTSLPIGFDSWIKNLRENVGA